MPHAVKSTQGITWQRTEEDSTGRNRMRGNYKQRIKSGQWEKLYLEDGQYPEAVRRCRK